jgi:hypothetical protein
MAMKIVMLSNFINHHQTPVADELYNMQGVEYWFIETKALPEEQRNLGYSGRTRQTLWSRPCRC